MKGVFIFNQMNDIIYLCADKQFKIYIKSKLLDCGLEFEDSIEETHPFVFDPNLIMQAFSPLIASIKFMTAQVKNSYESITFEDGFTFAFCQFGEDVYVAANGDGTESEDFMHRKLNVLHRVITFLYGPIADILTSDGLAERRSRYESISGLLDAWTMLQDTEQCFLVEAIERLHVNPMLNSRCIKLLESTMEVMKSGTEKPVAHALLIVKSKLLALYSSNKSSDLNSADLLMTILLVNSLFNWEKPIEVPAKGVSKQQNKETDSSDMEFFSIPSSPVAVSQDDQATHSEKSPESPRKLSESSSRPSTINAADNLEGIETKEAEPAAVNTFLRTPLCRYTPYTLYCIPVIQDTALVIVTEASKPAPAAVITHLLFLLKRILNMSDDKQAESNYRWSHQTALLDTNMRKLADIAKTYKGVARVEKMIAEICKKWEHLKKNNSFSSTSIPTLTTGIESSISHIKSCLKELFKLLYIAPSDKVQQNPTKEMLEAQNMTKMHLCDYSDYLCIKAQRNVTITTYLEDFPGLVHFIYVDRTADHMTAPSINISSHTESMQPDMSKILKEKVWKMWCWCQEKLADGYTAVTAKDGDLLFTYFVWFEDPMGNALNVQQPFRGSIKRPGILGGDFYRELIQEAFPGYGVRPIHCHELMCVHVGLVPPQYVTSHCRKLAAILWETSGEANSPISLL